MPQNCRFTNRNVAFLQHCGFIIGEKRMLNFLMDSAIVANSNKFQAIIIIIKSNHPWIFTQRVTFLTHFQLRSRIITGIIL